jgi:hypothetical protein
VNLLVRDHHPKRLGWVAGLMSKLLTCSKVSLSTAVGCCLNKLSLANALN